MIKVSLGSLGLPLVFFRTPAARKAASVVYFGEFVRERSESESAT